MATIGVCEIKNMQLSKRSKRDVADIKSIMESGNLLAGVLAATPFYFIFGTPSVTKSPFETMITIRENDWDTFGQAMLSLSSYTRNAILKIAMEREIFTNGEEQKFWGCVVELSK
ncbi:hypothetical protein CWO33_04795 [Vibrio splendidus]|uniref:hypothetical protein n=1 Tax=Vibrio splendidus TaxID=29497 RepID=UPI000D3D538A|nr:hypothetical protein [Vibrio splendidus]PTQ16943.1 hypothetical protein CWO33_04795 [Vibrio splendidus]